MARKNAQQKAPVSQETVDECLAHAVSQGDIVNFRFLFIAYSPIRDDSTEDIFSDKYAYLRPDDTGDKHFQAALALAKTPEMHAHVTKQLEKKGPAQLPAPLLLALADNAVRLGKYSPAAQAYELLRIRRRMQTLFLDRADAALAENDAAQAVRGYRIATGLSYDYAAFPEPLPSVAEYQSDALMLHAVYPRRPEECVALQPPDAHVNTALGYLLRDGAAAARLSERPLEQRLEFLDILVRELDSDWESFAARYREACALVDEVKERIERKAREREEASVSLADEVEADADEKALAEIPARLLGRSLENAEWWQYLKELAFKHPAAALFVSRQAVSKQDEIIMPRYVQDSPIIRRLGLEYPA